MRSSRFDTLRSDERRTRYSNPRRDRSGGGDRSAPHLVTDGGDPSRANEDPFGVEDRNGDRSGDPAFAEETESIEALLLSEGILEAVPGEDDLRLGEVFERSWHRRIEQLRGDDRALRWLATTRGVDPDDLEAVQIGSKFTVRHRGTAIGKWPSKATFLAELVSGPTLRERLPNETWEKLSEEQKREMSVRLLLFLEQCPLCRTELVFAEETDSEDGSVAIDLDCPNCGATVFSGAF